ncbi:MAG: AAA family ATPase [Halolamina sp.]
MRIIGTVGLPGSGKGEAADVAREEGLPVVTMGDVIREACRERGLDPSEHHGEVAQALREEHGETAIADRTVDRIREAVDADGGEGEDEDEGVNAVVVDGLRSPAEVEAFEVAFGEDFLVVAVNAPFDLRAERLGERGREATDLDRERLREREDRELGFGMGEVIAAADVTVDNTDTLAAFRDRVRRLLRAGPTALADEDGVTVADDAVEREGEA